MISVNQFLPRLHLFAESFTGLPVRIITSSRESNEDKIQTTNAVRIHVPSEVDINERYQESGFNLYKGLVALQASAIPYRGIPKSIKELDFGSARASNKTKNLEEFVLETECGRFLPVFYNIIELARRMQCIKSDYRVLSEDIQDGFKEIYNHNFLKKAFKYIKDKKDNHIVSWTTNEIDLAFTTSYWQNLGIEENVLLNGLKTVPPDSFLGEFRQELHSALKRLLEFEEPTKTSFRDSRERTIIFKDYIEGLCRDLDIANLITAYNEQELKLRRLEDNASAGTEAELTRDRDISKVKLEGFQRRYKELKDYLESDKNKNPEFGLDSVENIERRMQRLDKKINDLLGVNKLSIRDWASQKELAAEPYSYADGASLSIRTVFQEVPKDQLVQLTIPEELQESQSGKSLYFPEFFYGTFKPKAVRVLVYDLSKSQPPIEQQARRKVDLVSKLEKLGEEIAGYNKKIFSQVCDIFDDLQDIVKKRNSAEIKKRTLERQLRESEKSYEDISRMPLDIDPNVVRRIEREMERIKPEARKIVRKCFEGELDEKEYFEYWLQSRSGGSPLPNFYYKWEKRKRDVASVLLLDASHSVNKLSTEEKTVLDLMKEAAYYFVLGADRLEDRSAVIAYNGRGPRNSRVFLLKDFSESTKELKDRLELLKGELNNRDGSAIRYATRYLSDCSAKTRFLFHIGDMEPLDREIEVQSDAILVYPYEGDSAVQDVNHALNSARMMGIIPVGICIKLPEVKKQETKLKKGKLNLGVLQIIRGQTCIQPGQSYIDDMMKKNFRNQYRIVEQVSDLPRVLREAYIRTSFR